MAARLIREDQVSRKDRLKRADEARQMLAQEFVTLGSSVDMELRQRITTIHDNDATLDKQSKAVRSRVNTLTKITKQYSAFADNARIKLKEIGDIQNWAEMIEHDLLLVEETMRIVHDDDNEH